MLAMFYVLSKNKKKTIRKKKSSKRYLFDIYYDANVYYFA